MKTPMRHGVAVLLIVLLCASLFLVYNGNFSGSTRDGNDTRIRHEQEEQRPTSASLPRVSLQQQQQQQQQQQRESDHPQPKSEEELPPLQGYSGIIDHKPLRMHCRTCSLVTSSGHLIGGGRGSEIDQAECVIRMNDAPTSRGFSHDVGHRTSLRVIAHSSLQRVLRSRHELLNFSQDAVFIFWGPGSYMRRDGKGLIYNNLRLMSQILPKLKAYVISWQKMQQFDDIFKKETGKDRRISNSWLSTGWFTMTIALELCDRINVYGMVAPDFCREPAHQSVPYHYYEPRGPDECAMYISHERGRKGSHHRFITEKRVFAKWARTFDIHFYQPDWSPAPLPANHTAEKSEGAVTSAPIGPHKT